MTKKTTKTETTTAQKTKSRHGKEAAHAKPKTEKPRDERAGKGAFYDIEIVDENAKKIDEMSSKVWELYRSQKWPEQIAKRLEREAKQLFVSAIYQQRAASKK